MIAEKEAQQVEQIVKSEDLIVNDWDGVSVLYGNIWGKGYIFNLPTTAEEHGSQALDRLAQAITEAKQRGGKIYFLGVLDYPEQYWNNHLGIRGISYHSFDNYRKSAVPILSFKIDKEEISLRLLD